jgi:hypothetical protein
MSENMLTEIEATFPPVEEPVFEMPDEAIDFSKSIDRARQINDLPSCIGRTIQAADWSDDSLSLCLDNHKVLHFRCVKNQVTVTIDDHASDILIHTRIPDTVLLRLDGREIVWNRGKFIQKLTGKSFSRIQMSRSGSFLYVEDIGIVAVYVLIDCSTGRPFLFWEPTD